MLNRKTIIGLMEELGKEYDLFMGICACVSVVTDTAEEAKSNSNLPHLKLMSQAVKDGTKMLEEDAKFEWINVKDRLPDEDVDVLILVREIEHYGRHDEKRDIYRWIFTGWRVDGEWATTYCHGSRYIHDENEKSTHCEHTVTHWMPLPEPPEEDEE